MKLGLIMEGGGMSGVFTAGVMDVLMQNGIKFDGAIGVSAGAIFGSNIKSQQIGRVIRYNKKYCRDPRYCSLKSFIKTGDFFGADFCYRQLTYELDPFDYKAFANNKMEFYCVVTSLDTGKAVYHKCHDGLPGDMLWIRASASIPLLSRKVNIDGGNYLDGGLSDPIPIRFFESKGYKRNIVILTKHREHVAEPIEFMRLLKLRYFRYPDFLKTMVVRHIVYKNTVEYINEKEKNGQIVVIRPSRKTDAALIEHDPDNLQKTYEDGIAQCERSLEKIKKYASETKAM